MKKQKNVPSKPFWYSYKTGQKYEQKVNSDCEYFHSALEFKLYNEFLKFIPRDKVLRQVPLLYKPQTGVYPALVWKVDFGIVLPDEETLYIEAKGGWILGDSSAKAEFQHKLQFLEFANHRAWENLFLVSDQEMKLDSFYKTLKPSELTAILKMRMKNIAVEFRRNYA
jgi:hypothetical protein